MSVEPIPGAPPNLSTQRALKTHPKLTARLCAMWSRRGAWMCALCGRFHCWPYGSAIEDYPICRRCFKVWNPDVSDETLRMNLREPAKWGRHV